MTIEIAGITVEFEINGQFHLASAEAEEGERVELGQIKKEGSRSWSIFGPDGVEQFLTRTNAAERLIELFEDEDTAEEIEDLDEALDLSTETTNTADVESALPGPALLLTEGDVVLHQLGPKSFEISVRGEVWSSFGIKKSAVNHFNKYVANPPTLPAIPTDIPEDEFSKAELIALLKTLDPRTAPGDSLRCSKAFLRTTIEALREEQAGEEEIKPDSFTALYNSQLPTDGKTESNPDGENVFDHPLAQTTGDDAEVPEPPTNLPPALLSLWEGQGIVINHHNVGEYRDALAELCKGQKKTRVTGQKTCGVSLKHFLSIALSYGGGMTLEQLESAWEVLSGLSGKKSTISSTVSAIEKGKLSGFCKGIGPLTVERTELDGEVLLWIDTDDTDLPDKFKEWVAVGDNDNALVGRVLVACEQALGEEE